MERREKYNVFERDVIDELPPGLEREVLRVLQGCVGREQVISRGNLLRCVRSYPGLERVHERAVRAVINKLRKDEHPICSTGGEEGGYWMAESWEELGEYLDREVRSRLGDLAEQERALVKAGEALWGARSRQMGLGI